jgi:hypothetical protein
VVNQHVNKVLKKSGAAKALTKQHKRLLKWVKENVSNVRSDLASEEKKTDEKSLRKEIGFKRTLAIEKLLLSLLLVMCLPMNDESSTEDLEQMSAAAQEIEELKECYENMNLDQSGKSKKAKTQDADGPGAFRVLFDLLLSLLTKQQGFLREMANYVFKQFCAEMDQDTLGQMIKIVSTSNEKAADIMQENESEDSGAEEGEEEMSEDESMESDD